MTEDLQTELERQYQSMAPHFREAFRLVGEELMELRGEIGELRDGDDAIDARLNTLAERVRAFVERTEGKGGYADRAAEGRRDADVRLKKLEAAVATRLSRMERRERLATQEPDPIPAVCDDPKYKWKPGTFRMQVPSVLDIAQRWAAKMKHDRDTEEWWFIQQACEEAIKMSSSDPTPTPAVNAIAERCEEDDEKQRPWKKIARRWLGFLPMSKYCTCDGPELCKECRDHMESLEKLCEEAVKASSTLMYDAAFETLRADRDRLQAEVERLEKEWKSERQGKEYAQKRWDGYLEDKLKLQKKVHDLEAENSRHKAALKKGSEYNQKLCDDLARLREREPVGEEEIERMARMLCEDVIPVFAPGHAGDESKLDIVKKHLRRIARPGKVPTIEEIKTALTSAFDASAQAGYPKPWEDFYAKHIHHALFVEQGGVPGKVPTIEEIASEVMSVIIYDDTDNGEVLTKRDGTNIAKAIHALLTGTGGSDATD